MITVLVVEDCPTKYKAIEKVLMECGIESGSIKNIDNLNDSLQALENIFFDILILDMQIPINQNGDKNDNGGINLLKSLKHDIRKKTDIYKISPVIIGLTEHTDIFYKQAKFFKEQRVFAYKYDTSSNDWIKNIQETIEEYALSLEAKVKKTSHQKIIYSVHGIMSFGLWQNKLDSFVNNMDDYIHIKYKYNFFPIMSFLNLKKRSIEANRFKNELIALANRYPNARVDIIAHSFGTYLVADALEKLTIYNSPAFNKIILCGSVLKEDHDWQGVIEKFSLNKVVNDCGISDVALLMSHTFAKGFGKGGRNGFKNTIANTIINRRFKGGHGCFFKPNHIEGWVEFLKSDSLEEVDQRNEIGLINVIKKGLVKYSYLTIFLSISVLSYYLYF